MSEKKQLIEERSFEFAVRIVRLCQVLDEKPGVSRALANQLLRAGTSVGANVAEAQGGQSKKDFVAKMAIAAKEARETHYWIRLLTVSEMMENERLSPLLDEANQIVAILAAILKTSQNPAP